MRDRRREIAIFLVRGQWDQMVKLLVNIWPFVTMKMSPIMVQICQSRLSILPHRK